MMEVLSNQGRSGPNSGIVMDRYVVALQYGGRRIGLYRVKRVGEVGMLLKHGGISFPVGTRLDVEGCQSFSPDTIPPVRPASVVENTPDGLELAWCQGEPGEIR